MERVPTENPSGHSSASPSKNPLDNLSNVSSGNPPEVPLVILQIFLLRVSQGFALEILQKFILLSSKNSFRESSTCSFWDIQEFLLGIL